MKPLIGRDSIDKHGLWYAHRFLILRRLSQLSVIVLFLLGPLFGVWIIEGNMASSLLFGTVPLSDPYIVTQLAVAGHLPEFNALLGVAIIAALYWLFGGRTYCSWVCPINAITDLASFLRRTFGINSNVKVNKNTRHVLLVATLLTPLLVGYVAWELINPVSILNRGIIFGIGYGWLLIVTIFAFDLFIMRNGWCGHLCPMGAFYSLLGKKSLLTIKTTNREACNQCGDCYMVCPEPQVLKQPLRNQEHAKAVISSDCTRCGRCIDVCAPDVFTLDFTKTEK